jgi:DNA-binding protein
MEFRNYCLVIMGETKNVFSEIEKVSETQPNILDAKGILIATFSSALKPNELTDWFRLNKRNFLIFDLNPNASGFNILKKEIHNGLFGFITANADELNLKAYDLSKAIEMTSDTKNTKVNIKGKKTITEKLSDSDIKNMSVSQREIMLNKIMDKGVKNLSEEEKKLLQRLAK